jgi:SAM-dependent methyltransferase
MAEGAYDLLAPHYREYADGRATYLDAVDGFILERAPREGRMLDVGAGDGVRGMRLAQALGAERIVLCEPSPRMAGLCRAHGADEVWESSAQALPAVDERFDVVVCLWNVLGHLPDRAARVAALGEMRRLLAPGGRVYFDVNNRHNARAYGRWRVALRRWIDRLAPDDRRGDTSFEWRVADRRIPATGHLFTPREIEAIVLSAGLAIVRWLAIDYVTGSRSDDLREGQILVEARSLAEARP